MSHVGQITRDPAVLDAMDRGTIIAFYHPAYQSQLAAVRANGPKNQLVWIITGYAELYSSQVLLNIVYGSPVEVVATSLTPTSTAFE